MPLSVRQALIILVALTASVESVRAEDLASSLRATVTYQDFDGKELQAVAADVPFNISVSLTDAVTGTAPSLPGSLAGWIRPVEPTNAPCRLAAKNYRAAENQLPRGALDLNTALILNLTREANLHVVSPKLDLATANILSSRQLPELPASLVIHPVSQTAYFTLEKAGEIWSLRAYEREARVFAKGLARPTILTPMPDGGIWVAQEGAALTRFSATGQEKVRVPGFQSVAQLESDGNLLLVLDHQGEISVLRSDNGATVWQMPPEKVTAYGALKEGKGSFSVYAISGDGQSINFYSSRGDAVTGEKLAGKADKIAMSPDGRWLFAFSPKSQVVSVVDVATEKLVTALSFDSAVQEVAFVGPTAFMRLADSEGIASVGLNSLGIGKSAAVGYASFGVPQKAFFPARRLLLPLPSTEHLIAVQNGSEMGFAISAKMQSSQTLPQTGMLLKGGIPFQIALIEQGFREKEKGRLVAPASVPEAGDYELVLTTGIQGLTTCAPLTVQGAKPRKKAAVASMRLASGQSQHKAGIRSDVRLQLELNLKLPGKSGSIGLRINHLEGGWRKTVEGYFDGQDIIFNMLFPVAGTYAVVPLLPREYALKSVPQIEVIP